MTTIIILFLLASFVTSTFVVAAVMLSTRKQRAMYGELDEYPILEPSEGTSPNAKKRQSPKITPQSSTL